MSGPQLPPSMVHPKLPEGWHVYEFISTIEIYDNNGKIFHAEPKPYSPTPAFTGAQVVARAIEKLKLHHEPTTT